MPVVVPVNTAARAAEEALVSVKKCIDEQQSFILEAGAGAGKTYSLIDSLKYVIKNKGVQFERQSQRVACITYTNVAKDEIQSRTDRHSVIFTETIHAFCWSLIKDFQPTLRLQLPTIERWAERFAEQGEIGTRNIVYDLGHPFMDDKVASLFHDDVIVLTVLLLENEKFRKIWVGRYPILLIDEYQDTDTRFIEAIKKHFLGTDIRPLIGLFGDHWQKIYGSGCGKVEHPHLKLIPKHSNFRSVRPVVDVLNRMRPDLEQEIQNVEAGGSAKVFHTNAWLGERQKGGHWAGDLPREVAHVYLQKVQEKLAAEGWDFAPEHTKILMLTHNVLAEEQGYRTLADAFDHNESFAKKEDDHIAFFVDSLEPACDAFEKRRYGEMFDCLKMKTPPIKSLEDKREWSMTMDRLLELRRSGSIGDVIDSLMLMPRIRLPEPILRRELRRTQAPLDNAPQVLPEEMSHELTEREAAAKAREDARIAQLNKVRLVPYKEVTALAKFLNGYTCFSTKHGVKGAEFENVLVVVGRGWNLYNFDQMLGFMGSTVPADKQSGYERSRNLFYVACSRPKSRLAVLFTQKVSTQSLATLTRLFGNEAITSL